MPKKGWKSITVKESTYNRFYAFYQNHRPELRDKGIFDYSGFITYIMMSRIKERENLQKLALKITKIPERFEYLIGHL